MLDKVLNPLAVAVTAFAIIILSGLVGADQKQPAPSGSNAGQVLLGKIYQKGSNLQRLLFNFRKTQFRSGNEIYVTRTYTYPDGRTAAIEKATYQNGSLLAYRLIEEQINAYGKAEIQGDAWKGKGRISFKYVKDDETYTNVEDLEASTVVNDNIVSYMLGYWDTLMHGEEVFLRYIVIPRTQTVGFNLVKSGESTWRGKPAVIIKMEPASFFIRLVVDPVYFTVDKDTHHVVKYEGRVTPKIKAHGEWTDLDAVMVFPKKAS
jgi:hypothetical protein